MTQFSGQTMTSTLGTRIRAERKARGLTQKQLGESAGTSQQLIWRLENGTPLPDGSSPSTSFLFEIAEVLGVSAHWLETGKGPKEPAQWGRLGSPSDYPPGIADAMIDAMDSLRTGAIDADLFIRMVRALRQEH